MSLPTQHGHHISEHLWPYGDEPLTLADVWLIVDGLHSHFIEHDGPYDQIRMFEQWLKQLEHMDGDLPPD